MALDLWFREDVSRILAATYETMRASTSALCRPSVEPPAPYEQGFVDALRAIALAFGLLTPAARYGTVPTGEEPFCSPSRTKPPFLAPPGRDFLGDRNQAGGR